MKLRIAKKIVKAFNYETGHTRHKNSQLDQAMRRIDKTESWKNMMEILGVEGRAELLNKTGAPGMAFGLLMREEW